jgi:sterol 3beta-glucosyltransferase
MNWYVDEGAIGPISGFFASISDTVVKTWTSTHTYINDLSNTMQKDSTLQVPRSPAPERQPSLPDLVPISSAYQPPHPVQAALSYPPQHLERVAYRMASGTLPGGKKRSWHMKTHVWSPRLQMTTASKPPTSSKKQQTKEHGKAYEATDETRHFAYSILRTSLHGMCRREKFLGDADRIGSSGCAFLQPGERVPQRA